MTFYLSEKEKTFEVKERTFERALNKYKEKYFFFDRTENIENYRTEAFRDLELLRDFLQRFLHHRFPPLISNLYINNRIKREYTQSKMNFNILKKKGCVEYFLKNSSNHYEENEWEIPKGRRNNREKNKCCAIREFEEETNIKSNNYKLIYNNVPLMEEYKGINNVNYKHVYYIAKVNSTLELYIDPKNKDQNLEVNSIKWLNKKECLEKIRDYSYSKINVIKQFYNFIENMSADNIKNI